MKKDFESRFMPDVKFRFDKPTKVGDTSYPAGLYYILNDKIINPNQTGIIDDSFLNDVHYLEAIPELTPEGMRYNKELDKLVPDVIKDFKPKKQSMADWAKENINPNIVAFDDAEYNKEEKLSAKKTHRAYNVGSSNYASMKIQPWDIWKDWKLDPWDADIVKRISRTKEIPGKSFDEARIEDYEKIKHICDEKIYQLKEKINVK